MLPAGGVRVSEFTQFANRNSAFASPSHPLRAQQLRLREDGLHGLLLQSPVSQRSRATETGNAQHWAQPDRAAAARKPIAVFVQDAFHHHLDFRTGAFAEGPVDGHALLHLGDLEKCECRSANYEVPAIRHSEFAIRHLPRSLASWISSSMNCIVEMARSAPKGREMPAQGNALGSIVKNIPSPEAARHRLCRHFMA